MLLTFATFLNFDVFDNFTYCAIFGVIKIMELHLANQKAIFFASYFSSAHEAG